MSYPNKAERERCWSARDDLWNCLDMKKDDATQCQKQRELFENSCSKSWVKYFDRRREYLKYKDKIEKDGYEPLENKSKQ